ncbi:cardioactive peptide [Folsomia candida]|uniref:Cardioactive peptide n=1 Tax=Folsomia candida TaxID=158441 RepID=A0A226DFG5_FOLCA|nr:cardioactive peptide [Folsomia candida]OXA43919.1 Cardioactive peptide [Folsomia candida]
MDKSAFGLVLTLLVFVILSAVATPIQKRGIEEDGEPSSNNNPSPPRAKRTFCNAFTGCGRKRNGGGGGFNRDYVDYSEGGDRGSVVDSDSDSGMEDVARDILAEARLWEALQARNSLRPRQQQRNKSSGGYRGEMRRPLEEQLPN